MDSHSTVVHQDAIATTLTRGGGRAGFGTSVHLIGRVHTPPLFNQDNDVEGQPEISFTLACGEMLQCKLASRKSSVQVQMVEKDVGVTTNGDRHIGFLDRQSGIFYPKHHLISRKDHNSQARVRLIAEVERLYDLGSFAIPTLVNVVAFDRAALMLADMAVEDTVMMVEGYGRTHKSHSGKSVWFQIVATYVQLISEVEWGEEHTDNFISEPPENGGSHWLSPTVTVFGLIVEPPEFSAATANRADYLKLIVSGSYRANAIMSLVAVGERARWIAGRVSFGTLIGAKCRLFSRYHQGNLFVNFVIDDIAIFGRLKDRT